MSHIWVPAQMSPGALDFPAPAIFTPGMNLIAARAVSWINAGLSFIYPECCQLCRQRRSGPAQGYVCDDCRSTVKWINAPFCSRCGLPFEGDINVDFECSKCQGEKFYFQSARSAVVARDKVLDVIHRYKYSRALWFEPFLSELLTRRAAPELRSGSWDFIVPVPLHPTKYREREFNQAERLARHLGRSAGIPVNTGVLSRVLPTRTQTQLSREERQVNMRRAFAVRPGQRLSGRNIVLIDDVFTTGATTNACARALVGAGAAQVCVWTVARGV
jgi:competence protein ComFC